MTEPQFQGPPNGMPQPGPVPGGMGPNEPRPPAARWVLWLTVSVLVAAAVLGGVFIIIGDDSNVAGRVWMTFILVVVFAGAVLLDSSTDGPNRWYMPVSTVINVFIMVIGILKIWTTWLQVPSSYGHYSDYPYDSDYASYINGPLQFFRFLGLAVILRLALLITQIGWVHFFQRAKRDVTKKATLAVLLLIWVTSLVLVIPLSFPGDGWPGWWWRMSGATVLAAVILAVIPVVFRAFEPKPPKPVGPRAPYQQPYYPQPWSQGTGQPWQQGYPGQQGGYQGPPGQPGQYVQHGQPPYPQPYPPSQEQGRPQPGPPNNQSGPPNQLGQRERPTQGEDS